MQSAHKRVSDALGAVQRAEAAVKRAESRRHELIQLRAILSTQGKNILEPAVRAAFRVLGFSKAEPEDDIDAVLYERGRPVAVVEIEGTRGQVGIQKYRQLRDYIDERALRGADPTKGIIVGNGLMDTPLGERGEQFSPQLVAAAKRQKYCLLSTMELFKLVQSALTVSSAKNKKALRRQILEQTGVFARPQSGS